MPLDKGEITSIRRVLHNDWSKDPKGRWACCAERIGTGWRVFGPIRYSDRADWLFECRSEGAGIAGFDFPIGVPAFWAKQVGVLSFRDLLTDFLKGRRDAFFEVAEQPEDISLQRPFYPYRSQGGHRQASLLAGLGAGDIDDLMRACDRQTATRLAACCLFWTLGSKQVGKAALSGWQDVVIPRWKAGAVLWPFDGDLATLARQGNAIIAETYPAEAYGHIGVRFGPGMSKGRQNDRKAQADTILRWAKKAKISIEDRLREAIADGFGPSQSGADPFDALAGLAGMIEVVDGRRDEAPPGTPLSPVEGWILGQAA